jgi:hypothetical protein
MSSQILPSRNSYQYPIKPIYTDLRRQNFNNRNISNGHNNHNHNPQNPVTTNNNIIKKSGKNAVNNFAIQDYTSSDSFRDDFGDKLLIPGFSEDYTLTSNDLEIKDKTNKKTNKKLYNRWSSTLPIVNPDDRHYYEESVIRRIDNQDITNKNYIGDNMPIVKNNIIRNNLISNDMDLIEDVDKPYHHHHNQQIKHHSKIIPKQLLKSHKNNSENNTSLKDSQFFLLRDDVEHLNQKIKHVPKGLDSYKGGSGRYQKTPTHTNLPIHIGNSMDLNISEYIVNDANPIIPKLTNIYREKTESFELSQQETNPVKSRQIINSRKGKINHKDNIIKETINRDKKIADFVLSEMESDDHLINDNKKSIENNLNNFVLSGIVSDGSLTNSTINYDTGSSETRIAPRKNINKIINHGKQQSSNDINCKNQLIEHNAEDIPLLRNLKFHDKYIGIFSKGLLHDDQGYVNKDEMMKLITALDEKDYNKISNIKLGGKLKLVNLTTSWSNYNIGICRYTRLPSMSSDFIAAQMAELYCMSLTRDIPFKDYTKNHLIEDCCGYLNSLRKYPQVSGKVTPYNIFRGPMYGDLQGPYISQFLHRDIKMGGITYQQKYITDLEGYDFMKTWDTAISAQNGNIIEIPSPVRDNPRYIINGRDLFCYINFNKYCQLFHNTYNILIDLKIPINLGFTPLINDQVGAFNIEADIISTLNIIADKAILSAFNMQWNTMFFRPEALGIEIERIYRNNSNEFLISPELLRNPVLKAIKSKNGNRLLSQAHYQGAPLHPSNHSEYAAIAGACITVLKFFFNTKCEIDIYAPDSDGKKLVNTGMKSTIEDELNKLACNIGISRMWAGVNYHKDIIRGLKLGEKIAINHLQCLLSKYPYDLNISFNRFNNKVVTLKTCDYVVFPGKPGNTWNGVSPF